MPRTYHACFAAHCPRRIYAHLLMCAQHWRMVPPDLRRAVWSNYQSGQEKPDGPAPTDTYLDVIRQAQLAVAEQEGVTA